ncbi:MAG TPA: hypothetical protein P5074_05540 [Candidatus Nanopelagicales bacterium]|nr:hypothetical protein [Candidatus Nanopelagicales bacterium]
MDNDVPGDTAEVRRLKAQINDLQQATAKPRRQWVRTFWSTLLIVVACVLAPLSVVSVWARGEVTDTSRYVQTVAPLASDPAVQQAVTNRITAEIFTYIDVPGLTSEAVATISENRSLTPRQTAALEALTGPLNSGIESFTEQTVQRVVQSEQFEAAWVEANTLVHQRLNAALSGENVDNALQVENNQVVLDLSNLITQVKQRLVDRGLTVAENIPATTSASIVLFNVPNATSLQTGYSLLNAVGFWLPLIAIALAVLGIFISHRPRRALAWFGFGLLVAMTVAAGALAAGRLAYTNELPVTVDTAAATAIFDQFTYFLRQSLWAGAAGGAVLLFGGLLLGDGNVATGIRRVPVRAAAAIRRWLVSLGLQMQSVHAWVSAQATGLRIAASLAALVFVMLQRYKTPELILWTTAGLLVVLFVIEIFAADEQSPAQGDQVATPTT